MLADDLCSRGRKCVHEAPHWSRRVPIRFSRPYECPERSRFGHKVDYCSPANALAQERLKNLPANPPRGKSSDGVAPANIRPDREFKRGYVI
jgi:hypothetical protein